MRWKTKILWLSCMPYWDSRLIGRWKLSMCPAARLEHHLHEKRMSSGQGSTSERSSSALIFWVWTTLQLSSLNKWVKVQSLAKMWRALCYSLRMRSFCRADLALLPTWRILLENSKQDCSLCELMNTAVTKLVTRAQATLNTLLDKFSDDWSV